MALIAFASPIGAKAGGDPEAGRAIFWKICPACRAALPYIGWIGVDNLPAFLANPRRCKPSTAMTIPGLHSEKDIMDLVAFITANP